MEEETSTTSVSSLSDSGYNTRSSIDCSSTTLNSSGGKDPINFPPGPSGLPLFGSAFKFKGPKTSLRWTQEYGPIYHVKMGDKDLIYLNTLDLVKKYMEGKSGDQFLDRPMGPAAIAEGLLFGSGKNWERNKKAFMKAMHTKTFMEDLEGAVQSEVNIAMDALRHHSHKKKAFSLSDVMLSACANAIAGLLLGGSLAADCPERQTLHSVVKNMEGCDLSSIFTKITLKHPKLREPLSKVFFKDIVDVHGTSRRLQRLLRQWIHQTRTGHCSPSPLPSSRQPKLQAPISGGRPALHIPQDEEMPMNSEPSPDSPNQSSETISSDEGSDSLDLKDEVQKKYVSTESLLSEPKNKHRVDTAIRSSAQLAIFGFSQMSKGEQAYEEPEPPIENLPLTPITEYQWKFKCQMSINEKHESILHRILKQPEFAGASDGNDSELLQSLVDMFFGGVTSVLSGLEFILMYLSKNPTMQLRAQHEISSVLEEASQCNGQTEITWALRDRMPYLHACITEGLRLGAVTPSSLPHVASVDTEIEGYSIPKGTFVLASIYSLHHDPVAYIDPHEFRPQRHLNSDGQYVAPECYRPYGIGARNCVGDMVSEMELFLYTANILRHFHVNPASSKKAADMETHMRIIHRLIDFRCILEEKKVLK